MKKVHLITLLFVLGKETVGIETNDTEHSSDHREPEDEDKSRDHCTSASNGKYNWTKAGHVLGTVGFSLGQLTKETRLCSSTTTAFILLSANNSSAATTTILLLAKPVISELNNQIVDVFVWLADLALGSENFPLRIMSLNQNTGEQNTLHQRTN